MTIQRNLETINDDLPLYNSRVLNVYLAYVQKHYPEVDVDEVLAYARIGRHELDDLGHWFTQKQTDRFQEIIESLTKDQDIPRMAGRHAALSSAGGPARQYVLSLANPSSAYLLMGRLYKIWSKGAFAETRRLARNRVEIKTVPTPGVLEKKYQCENRTGTLEAIAALFTGKLAYVEHPECFHRGDPCCRYIISWIQAPAHTWRLLQKLILPIGITISIIGLFSLPLFQGLSLFAGLAAAWLGLGYNAERITRQDLAHRLDIQGNAAKDLLSEIDGHTNDAFITKEIGRSATGMTDLDTFLQEVTAIIGQHLNYDRGMILLADENVRTLECRAVFGHNRSDEARLKKEVFSLEGDDDNRLPVRVFKEKRPFLTNDLTAFTKQHPDIDLDALEKLAVRAFICLPIVYKDKAIGVIAVGNIRPRRHYRSRDLNFLFGIASQIATNIANVTGLKRLSENEVRYRTLFDTAISSLYVFDGNGQLIDINAATIAMQGFTLAEMQAASRDKLIHADSLPAFNAFFDDVSAGGTVAGTARCLHKNGAVIDVEYHGKSFTIGGQQRFFLSARDISARIKAEWEKQEVQLKLSRARKMEALGLLAGGVAHDLNNILSGIVSYPELLLMDLPAESDLRRPIEIIQESGKRAAAVVADLVTIARGAASSREVINLNALVDEYMASPEYHSLHTVYPEITVTTELAADLLNTNCSSAHVKKTLVNLVINAAEAMDTGGEVCICTANRYLDKPLQGYDNIQTGEYAVLTVSDQGGGITAEDTERIFEPFYTRKVMGRSGTGLGLAIVWNTLQDHQGYIDVRSSSRGTAFHLYFPITRKQPSSQVQAHPPLAAYTGGGQKILVVDDEKTQRVVAGELLTRLGYEVTAVSSGEAAVAYLKTHAVDLLVLDMVMDPGMNGRQTYEKALELHPGQKAIIASGYSENREVRAARKLGAGCFLKKPYTLEAIGRAVKKELAGV